MSVVSALVIAFPRVIISSFDPFRSSLLMFGFFFRLRRKTVLSPATVVDGFRFIFAAAAAAGCGVYTAGDAPEDGSRRHRNYRSAVIRVPDYSCNFFFF